jgi:hypothetical protein
MLAQSSWEHRPEQLHAVIAVEQYVIVFGDLIEDTRPVFWAVVFDLQQ